MNLSTFRSFAAAALLGASTLLCSLSAQAANTLVRVHTTQGLIDFKLLDDEAPISVANFLAYVNGGDYASVMIHRSVPGFVIQSGGYRWPDGGSVAKIASRGAIKNEFSATRSNLRGTVAMAKIGGNPDSATSEWFVNLSNNASNLDNQNGGFTVFARVTAPGMAVADKIAKLKVINAGSPFNELPVVNWISGTVERTHAVLLTRTAVLPSATDVDRVFNYLEAQYPQFIDAASVETGTTEGYTYRHYPLSNAYVGVKDGKLYYLVPAISPGINELGSLADWLAQAQASGY